MNKLQSARQGLTILEMLVALAIGVVVLLGLNEMMSGTDKSLKRGGTFDSIKLQVKDVVSRRIHCDGAFRNAANTQIARFGASVPAANQVGTIVIGGSTVVTNLGDRIGGGLELNRMELIATGPSYASGETVNATVYPVKLILGARSTDANDLRVVNNENAPLFLNITVDNSTLNILNCGN